MEEEEEVDGGDGRKLYCEEDQIANKAAIRGPIQQVTRFDSCLLSKNFSKKLNIPIQKRPSCLRSVVSPVPHQNAW